MNLKDAWDIIKSNGTEFPDGAQARLDLKIVPHFNFNTRQFVQWCSDAGITISILNANELLMGFPKQPTGPKVCSNTDPETPWMWMLNRQKE